MNWVDLAVVAIAIVSALLGFARGFVRESLGVGAWVGAGYLAVQTAPLVQDKFVEWLGNTDVASPASYGVMFVVSLIALSMLSGWIGSLVHAAGLGGVDRSLGALFGAVRGFAIVVLAYIILGLFSPPGRWGEAVQTARLLPYVAESAEYVTDILPPTYRPSLPTIGGTSSGLLKLPALLQPQPGGRAR